MSENERDVQTLNGESATPAPATPNDTQEHIRRLNAESAERRRKIAELEAELNRVKETRLADDKKWEELAEKYQKERDELSPYKSQMEQMSATLGNVLAAQLDTLTAEARVMVEDMPGTTQEKLDWLAKNAAKLTRPSAPNMDAGARGDSAAKTVKLTPEQEQALAHAQRVDPKMTRERYIARLLQMQGGG